MSLTPKDIDALTFSRALLGYDPDEVDAALDRIALHVHRMSRELAELAATADDAPANTDREREPSREPASDAGPQTGPDEGDVAALRAALARSEEEQRVLREEIARLRRALDAAWADARADQPRPVPKAVTEAVSRRADSW
ncbi:MAG: DivIVA domain-containing protein [Nitriliruptoraceae bacterium]